MPATVPVQLDQRLRLHLSPADPRQQPAPQHEKAPEHLGSVARAAGAASQPYPPPHRR